MENEEKNDEVITEEENDDTREEETKDEIRDEDYANDDEIEMDKSLEDKLNKVLGKLDSLYDTIAMFVDSGAVIREATPDDITEDDFAEDFTTIDELDLSLD